MTRAAAFLLLVGAVLVAWPARSGLRRLGPRPRVARRRPDPETLLLRAPGRLTLTVSLTATTIAYAAGGPVAAFAAGAYAALAMRLVVQQTTRRRVARQLAADLDSLSALAADLRAGGSLGSGRPGPGHAAPGLARHGGADPGWAGSGAAAGLGPGGPSVLGQTLAAVRQLSERTGAPVADLLDRIEADGRAADRARSSAHAEAAGTRMTAWLLMALPGGGMALGYSVGVDPLHILLRTPVGALCTALTVVLHVAGVLWSDRLAHHSTPDGGSRIGGGPWTAGSQPSGPRSGGLRFRDSATVAVGG